MTKEEFNVSIAHEFIDFRDEIVQWKDEEEIFEMAKDICLMETIRDYLVKENNLDERLFSYQENYPHLLHDIFTYNQKKDILVFPYNSWKCFDLVKVFLNDPEIATKMNDYVFTSGVYRYLEEGEKVFRYVIEGNLFLNGCIIPEGGSDIVAGLEDTLHRILDNGGNAEDIRKILGAVPFEELQTMGLNEESCISIDLGYYLPGTIFSA